MSEFYFSEEESKFFNLRISRGRITTSSGALGKAILEGNYDVCRVKVGVNELNIINQLEQLGFPYHFAGEVINYSITLQEINKMNLETDNKAISYEKYDGSQEGIVKEIILKSCSDDPIGYYKTPFLNQLISSPKETRFLASYFSSTYKTENRVISLMKKNGRYAGLIAYAIDGNVIQSLLITLLPEYRHYATLNQFMKEAFRYTIERNVPLGVCGARINNRMMQHILEKFGMKKTGADIIFHITPFLGVSNTPARSVATGRKSAGNFIDPGVLHRQAYRIARSLNGNIRPLFIRYRPIKKLQTVKISSIKMQPVILKRKHSLFLTKAYDKNEEPVLLVYSGFSE